ncbi:MAG: FIST C-terminal domain-containing protein [Christensenellaceae bacterium]|jgi:hypothetical protein|nr:FIST C-terminal domain-containing protein [Christensenellaceae bacterium]
MINLLYASTTELDDVDLAIKEIHDGLQKSGTILKYAAGIITCHAEFVHYGITERLCKSLPFNIVGTTTNASSLPGQIDTIQLSLSVLTSDTVQMIAVATGELTVENSDEQLKNAYNEAISKLTGNIKPKMMITFGPLMTVLSGEDLVDKLTVITDGLPIYGSISLDHNDDYHQAQTIYNGTPSFTKLNFLLLAGDFDFKFKCASISPACIILTNAIITKSNGSILMEVNDMKVKEYFRTLGLITANDTLEGSNIIPFVLDYKDGTEPVVRAIFMLDENEHAVCGGNMPVGSSLSIGSLNRDDVLSTTKNLVQQIIAEDNPSCIYLFSCIARNFALGVDMLAEMNMVDPLMKNVPYHFSYAGGEICPVYNSALKKWINRFHNDTISICIFR